MMYSTFYVQRLLPEYIVNKQQKHDASSQSYEEWGIKHAV